MKKFSEREEAVIVGCLEGCARVDMPKALAVVIADPLIVAPAEAVWAGGTSRLGVAVDSPSSPMQ